MITEVFQGVFSEIGPLFDEYLIEETDGKKLIDEMKKHMKNIIKCYNDKNKDNLYSALKNLRYVATKFQIQCVKSAKRKNTVSESL
ncbi:hypothetical protein [Methanoregula sp.]|uniref:hypothetical protein n=1 Tax=Methanoregula sp. TaxID=2052170 RepID=UPI0035691A10